MKTQVRSSWLTRRFRLTNKKPVSQTKELAWLRRGLAVQHFQLLLISTLQTLPSSQVGVSKLCASGQTIGLSAIVI